MAKVMISPKQQPRFGSVPYGNMSFLPYFLKTNATGAVINAEGGAPAPLAVNDKVYLGDLPRGFMKDEVTTIVSVGMTAAMVGDLGIEYKDGVDSTVVPQSQTYFATGLVLSTPARLVDTGFQEPIPLPKDAWLVLTVRGAASAKDGVVSVLVSGEQR